jgi:lysozyme
MTARELVARFEGCRLEAYRCPAGVWTIGYGHVRDVRQGQKITQHQADVILDSDLDIFTDAVRELCPGATPNQEAALVSFAFNVGVTALANSTLRRKFLAGDIQGAADQFLRWVNAAGEQLPGLVARRRDERAVFLGAA